MLSGSKSVPGLTAPAIVTVAAWMPSSRTPAAISVCAERRAAFPIEGLASAGTGLSAKPPLASCPQEWRGYLCRDDGAEDIDVVGGSEPLDGGAEDLAWIWQGSVVHDDTGGPRGAEDPFERLAVAVQILHIDADLLYLKAAAPP